MTRDDAIDECARTRKGDGMRKIFVLPLAGLLALTVAAPAMAGPNVSNTSGSLTLAQGGWKSWDDATQSSSYGEFTVAREDNGDVFAQVMTSTAAYVQCTGQGTPDDPDDDTFGAIGSNLYGYGPASLTIDKNYGSATAAGTLEAGRETFNDCTGEYGWEDVSSVDFTLALTASSGTIRETGRGSFKIPGEFNGHSSYKAIYRYAEGTLALDGGTNEVYGQVGKVSWTDHSNG